MSDLSDHDWVACVWRRQRALVCGRCGYLWKPSLARPTKDCADDRRPGTGLNEGGSHPPDAPRAAG